MENVFCSLDKAIDDDKRGSDYSTVIIPMTMKKVFDYENDTNTEVQMVSAVKKGLWERNRETQSTKTTHSFEANLKVGFVYDVIKLEASANYSYNNESYHESMTGKEIYSGEEITMTWKVPPKTKLTRWQLVATMKNEIIGFDKIIDTNEDLTKEMEKATLHGKAEIMIPRQIIYGRTKVRIRHKETNKYLTPVLMENQWDAITLKQNSDSYFELHKSDKGVRIKALKSTFPEYCYVYSVKPGGQIYLDKHLNNDMSQVWIIGKSGDLRNGDVITFRNKKWQAADLCFIDKKGEKTNVFCSFNCEQEWVLEM